MPGYMLYVCLCVHAKYCVVRILHYVFHLYVFHSIHVIHHVCYLQVLTDTGQLSLPGGGALSSSKCPLLPAMVAAKDPTPGSEPLKRADCATSWPWRTHSLQ